MNKKLKIAIGIIAAILLILIIRNILKDKNDLEDSSETEIDMSNVQYDEENDEYYIEDEETGEVLYTAKSESDLYIYTIDPDYDPQNPDAISDEEIYDEELEEN